MVRDGDDSIARLDAALFRRRSGGHHANNRRLVFEGRHIGALVQHDRQEDDGQEQVHRRAHDEHEESLPFVLRQELVRPTGSFLVRVLARHLYVTAERQSANPVDGLAPADAEDRRVEPELKFQHANADAFGSQKMPELMHEHKHAEHERK